MKKILLASANVLNNRGHLEFLKAEREAIIAIGANAVAAGKISIEKEVEWSYQNLFDNFNNIHDHSKINLLHYTGHSDDGQLILQADGGGNVGISAKDFSDFIKQQDGLEVVFLNSCASESIGQYLTENGVPIVIETTKKINDFKAAEFAKAFYKGMMAGKSLYDSFLQATVFYKTNFGLNYETEVVETTRAVSGYLRKDSKKTFAWKLSYQDENFAKNWYLVESVKQKIATGDFSHKILSIYDSDFDHHPEIHKIIDAAFSNDSKVYSCTLEELGAEITDAEAIQELTHLLVYCSDGFSGFWGNLSQDFKNALIHLPVVFVNISGDVPTGLATIQQSFPNTAVSVFPSPQESFFMLHQAKMLDAFFNNTYKEKLLELLQLNAQKSSVILSGELKELNFKDQRDPFEINNEHSFQYGQHNLLLLEGSPHCAQEVLIKKLLRYAKPRIDQNIKPHVISINSNIAEKLTESKLYEELSHVLLKARIPLTIELLSATIQQKIAEEDLIIILNDIYKNNGDCLSILQNLWNKLIQLIPDQSAHRLFIFAVYKDGTGVGNEWNTDGFTHSPPKANVRLFHPIKPLDKFSFNSWHANSENNFSQNSAFHQLINDEKIDVILEDPYMKKAIAQICHLMDCPEISSDLLEF